MLLYHVIHTESFFCAAGTAQEDGEEWSRDEFRSLFNKNREAQMRKETRRLQDRTPKETYSDYDG